MLFCHNYIYLCNYVFSTYLSLNNSRVVGFLSSIYNYISRHFKRTPDTLSKKGVTPYPLQKICFFFGNSGQRFKYINLWNI